LNTSPHTLPARKAIKTGQTRPPVYERREAVLQANQSSISPIFLNFFEGADLFKLSIAPRGSPRNLSDLAKAILAGRKIEVIVRVFRREEDVAW
jgi:hypothetical protein